MLDFPGGVYHKSMNIPPEWGYEFLTLKLVTTQPPPIHHNRPFIVLSVDLAASTLGGLGLAVIFSPCTLGLHISQ